MTTTTDFFTLLSNRCVEVNSLLCVGLDPHVEELGPVSSPENGAQLAHDFCLRLIHATSSVAAAYKPNAAFFECFGHAGVAALERVIKAVPAGIPVILDSKRGDISTTAQAYAQACFVSSGAHAVTVNAYMGYDCVEPFAKYHDRGVFVLCKTSNKSSEEFSAQPLQTGGEALYERVATACGAWHQKTHNIGLVVGATDIDALERVRAAAPELWILAPGLGFQGGDLVAAVQAGIRADGLGLLLPVSRAISRAAEPGKVARDLRDAVNQVRAQTSKRPRTDLSVAVFQRTFFELAHSCGVLKFGEFTLKSGRKSPYFFNAGLFNTGRAASQLAQCYASAIVAAGLEYDVLFGPAYKGIPLVATVAAELFARHRVDKPFAYNRKEEKDHGEGGSLVGAAIGPGCKVLILDDVITAGTAVRESISLLKGKGANVVGLVVAIDRQEVAPGETKSAVQAVQDEFGITVVSIVTLESLLAWAQSKVEPSVLESIVKYRSEFGVKKP